VACIYGEKIPEKPAQLEAMLEYLDFDAQDVTSLIKQRSFKLEKVDLLVFASYSLSDLLVKNWVTMHTDALREFIRKGGYILMFTQHPMDWNWEHWLLPGMSLFRTVLTLDTLGYVNRNHPIFSSPNALAHRRLNREWKGGDLSLNAFRAVSKGWILAARDEKGLDPWCVEFGWGKGRAVFFASDADRVSTEATESKIRAARDMVENALVYGADVVRGKAVELPDFALVKESKKGILPRASFYTSDAIRSFEAEVNAAADRGAAFLMKKQAKDGSWKSPNSFPMGATALSLVALLGVGINKHDPCIQQGIDFLLANRPEEATYELGFTLMALDAYAAPMFERFELEKLPPEKREAFKFERALSLEMKEVMEKCLDRLIENQRQSGWWSYGFDDRLMTDLSNTQIAILGLRAASRCGLKVPIKVWTDAIDLLLQSQIKEGEKISLPEFKSFDKKRGLPKFYIFQTVARPWGYRSADVKGPIKKGPINVGGKVRRFRPAILDKATGSRTAMGASSLLIALDGLAASSKGKANTYLHDVRQAVSNGIAWLWNLWSVDENPGADQEHYFYYLYALERLGMVSGKKFIGDRDWFQEGAIALLALQEESGAWGSNDIVDTCFALMFLKRSTPPSVITVDR
jgi:hypothetical protein